MQHEKKKQKNKTTIGAMYGQNAEKERERG